MLNVLESCNDGKISDVYITCLHLKHGGVEMAITTLANALSEYGYRVEILCTYHLGQPAYELHPEVKVKYLTSVKPNREAFRNALKSKKVFSIILEGLYALKVLFLKKHSMKQAIRSIQHGIIISTRNEHSLLLSKYGRIKVKKIAQMHSDHNFEPKLIHSFQTGYSNIDYFVLLTEKTTSEVKTFLQNHNSYTRCVTIPNFIEPICFQEPIIKKKQVIAAGRLHPDKDFACLLRIWKKVCEKRNDYKLLIVGEGILEKELKNQAETLGISNYVEFTGPMPHNKLLEEMAASCCYALTSVSESFGLVLVESMMCGAVPIAFDIRVGPEAIIDDGKNGVLIPNRNEELFADTINKLIKNISLRNCMEEQAKVKARQFYKEQVLPQWVEMLNN